MLSAPFGTAMRWALVVHVALALSPPRWRRLPTGVVEPRGWLETQLQRQARALTSHLPLFWANVANSSWLGGFADVDGGLHENTPYWLNGAVPLAVQLQDAELLSTVERYLDEIFRRQAESGWLGPDTDVSDIWSRMPFLLALVQYHEAMPERRRQCEDVALRFFEEVGRRLEQGLLRDDSWTSMRAHDLIWSLHYFAEEVPAAEARLLALAEALHRWAYAWDGWFNGSFPEAAVALPRMESHGVNNAQAIKAGVVWGRQRDARRGFAESWLAWSQLRRFHGQPHGAFGADEHLAGRLPSRGTELCVVVESLWSLLLVAQLAPSDAEAVQALDAVEDMAFNALPGSLSQDFWSHPYLQLANSFQALSNEPDHIWTHDGPDSAMYGLEPNYPCCTANFHQGYPKFTANLFFQGLGGELISAIWAPSRLQRKGLSVELRTAYPVEGSVEYWVGNEEPLVLKIRLPRFLREDRQLQLWQEGKVVTPRVREGFLNVKLEAGPWRSAVRLAFVLEPRLEAVDAGRAVRVGPLLMALDLEEQKRLVRRYAFEAADWDTVATRSWRLGLAQARWGVLEPAGRCPRLAVELVELEEEQWPTAHGAPSMPGRVRRTGHRVNRTLLPYACTSIRISVFPSVVDESHWV